MTRIELIIKVIQKRFMKRIMQQTIRGKLSNCTVIVTQTMHPSYSDADHYTIYNNIVVTAIPADLGMKGVSREMS